MDKHSLDDLFDRCLDFPDIDAHRRYSRLVGVDEAKSRLSKLLAILVNPIGPKNWGNKFHPDATVLIDYVQRRPPLVILAGDVGTGKTELAETVGDAVARQEGIPVTLYPLSLATRGSGKVGEMTKLVSAAFDATLQAAEKLKHSGDSKAGGGVILLVDEADALTQSRDSEHMHHEDRAGVNAFIRGVDRLAEKRLPAAIILCTNRLSAIDPAVLRRSADIFEFSRPNDAQRRLVIEPLTEAGFSKTELDKIVQLTEGYTFSDFTQRFMPTLVLDAYPNRPVTFARTLEIISTLKPTPAFRDNI